MTSIKQFLGHNNYLLVNRALIRRLGGDFGTACFAGELFFWSLGANSEGWFARSHEDWLLSLGMNRHAVDRAVRRLRKAGWVETQTKRTIFGPTLHYRIDETKFWAWMESKEE
jgi:hypothetical protein